MNNVHESSNSVQSADDELDPLEFMKVELHEGKGGKTFSLKNQLKQTFLRTGQCSLKFFKMDIGSACIVDFFYSILL